jgi:hypothetical protein
MRSVYLFLLTAYLPAVAGTISAFVAVQPWLANPPMCTQSANNSGVGLEASASCSSLGATVSATQSGWNASVSAGMNSDWREAASTSATLTYIDSLMIVGDTGDGFIQLAHSTTVAGSAFVSYSFAGQLLGCGTTSGTKVCMPDPSTIQVPFGVPLSVGWQLNAYGGCSGDGSCTSSSASTLLGVISITRADGSPSTGHLEAIASLPEPSTILLTAIGGTAIVTFRFRRRC